MFTILRVILGKYKNSLNLIQKNTVFFHDYSVMPAKNDFYLNSLTKISALLGFSLLMFYGFLKISFPF